MARKLVVRSSNDEVWVIDLDPPGKVKELDDNAPPGQKGERTKMLESLVGKGRLSASLRNAILGDDDIIKKEAGTGHDRYDGI